MLLHWSNKFRPSAPRPSFMAVAILTHCSLGRSGGMLYSAAWMFAGVAGIFAVFMGCLFFWWCCYGWRGGGVFGFGVGLCDKSGIGLRGLPGVRGLGVGRCGGGLLNDACCRNAGIGGGLLLGVFF